MSDLPFSDLLDRLEARDTAPPGDPRAVDPRALADTQLIEGEGVLEAWLASRGRDAARSTRAWTLANRSAGAVLAGTGPGCWPANRGGPCPPSSPFPS